MREIVEIARSLTFTDASARCKQNPDLSVRPTRDGSGFSVWKKESFSPPMRSSDTEGWAEYVPVHDPFMCHRCSGRGRSISGDVCTLCSGTGNPDSEPPKIAHSLGGPNFPAPDYRPNSGLSQLDIRRILLAQEQLEAASEHKQRDHGNRHESCHQCGGDGGAGGRCPRCGGNGFEPQHAAPPF